MEAGEVVIFFRDSGGSSGAGMEDFSINPFRGIHAPLDHGDTFVEGVADVGAGLGVTPLVEVADRVVVGVGDVILCPVMLDNALGILFIAFAL